MLTSRTIITSPDKTIKNGKQAYNHYFRPESYLKEFVGGKLIGNQIFDERDLADYQVNMKGRRLFLSNLSFET